MVSKFPLLSETFVVSHITGLIDRGHEVDIFPQSEGDMETVHDAVVKYGLMARTYFTPKRPRNVFAKAAASMRIFGHSLLGSPRMTARAFAGGRGLGILRAAVPFSDKQAYDIVHCHFGPNGVRAVELRDIGAVRGKIVTTFHGYDGSRERYDAGYYERLFGEGDLFLPVSEILRGGLIELGCDERKVLVRRMGVDIGRFRFSERRPDGRTVTLVSVARLVEKKGIEYGIRAFAEVARDRSGLRYLIAGDGPLRPELADLVAELGLDEKVSFLGAIRADTVPGLLAEAHMLVAPSVTAVDGDAEGVPLTIMEAMASGMPVVASRHGGIPELVVDGESAFLVPERDVDALAERITHLIENPDVWPKMGRAGRAFVEEHFNIEKLNDQLVELYRRAMDG